MPAVEAGLDLSVVALCVLALGLLLAAKGFARAIAAPFNIDLPLIGRKFAFIGNAIETTIVEWLNDAIKGVERTTARFFSGLIDSLAIFVGVGVLILILVKDALAYLWHHALRPLVEWYVGPIRTTADSALSKVTTLADTVAADFTRAEHYADVQARDAYRDAVTTLRPEITAGVSAAERYASEAVEKLRAAEDTAIGHALTVAIEAQNAGIAAAASAATEAEGIAAHALAASEAAATAALAGVKAIAVGAEHELDVIAAGRDAAGLAALIASIPLLATFVHTLATDTGLENQECRSKVKDICRTDPSAWANLLGGLAALGFAFSLRELVHVATPLIGELGPIIRKAA